MDTANIQLSVAVSGQSVISGMLQERLKERYPNVVIFDRDAEARLGESEDDDDEFIPQVAYMDILFSKSGGADMILIRCFHQHRLFNYNMDDIEPGSRIEKDMLDNMMAVVESMWTLPGKNPIQRYLPPENDDSEAADSASENAMELTDKSKSDSEQEPQS